MMERNEAQPSMAQPSMAQPSMAQPSTAVSGGLNRTRDSLGMGVETKGIGGGATALMDLDLLK